MPEAAALSAGPTSQSTGQTGGGGGGQGLGLTDTLEIAEWTQRDSEKYDDSHADRVVATRRRDRGGSRLAASALPPTLGEAAHLNYLTHHHHHDQPTVEAAQQAQQPRRQRQAEGTATPPFKAIRSKLGHLKAGSAKPGGGGGKQQLQQHGAGASAGARQGLRQGRQPAPLTHQPPRMTSVVTPVPMRSGRGQGLAAGTKRSSSETHETTPPQSPPAFQVWA